jgi:hypothetical protein
MPRRKAKREFTFYTSMNMVEMTGRTAKNIHELLDGLQEVEGACIFYHTHQAFLEHRYALREYPHDFAYWSSYCLQDEILAEKLSWVNINEFTSIRSLRQELIKVIKGYLNEFGVVRDVLPGLEFHFCKSISIAVPTNYVVWNLVDFCTALENVGLYSFYYHFFVARLRFERHTNDFSVWFEEALDNPKLAKEISSINPYMFTLEELKKRIIDLVKLEIKLGER